MSDKTEQQVRTFTDEQLRKHVADEIRRFVDKIQFVYVTTASDMYRLADQYERGEI